MRSGAVASLRFLAVASDRALAVALRLLFGANPPFLDTAVICTLLIVLLTVASTSTRVLAA